MSNETELRKTNDLLPMRTLYLKVYCCCTAENRVYLETNTGSSRDLNVRFQHPEGGKLSMKGW